MKISPNWPYEDENKYWAVFCLSKVKKQVAEKELQRRTSLYYFCFLPLLGSAPAILPIKTNWKIGKRPPATGMRPKR